jgi:hypothetical protein
LLNVVKSQTFGDTYIKEFIDFTRWMQCNGLGSITVNSMWNLDFRASGTTHNVNFMGCTNFLYDYLLVYPIVADYKPQNINVNEYISIIQDNYSVIAHIMNKSLYDYKWNKGRERLTMYDSLVMTTTTTTRHYRRLGFLKFSTINTKSDVRLPSGTILYESDLEEISIGDMIDVSETTQSLPLKNGVLHRSRLGWNVSGSKTTTVTKHKFRMKNQTVDNTKIDELLKFYRRMTTEVYRGVGLGGGRGNHSAKHIIELVDKRKANMEKLILQVVQEYWQGGGVKQPAAGADGILVYVCV